MICPNCGYNTEQMLPVCPECGQTLQNYTETDGIMAMRQGRSGASQSGQGPVMLIGSAHDYHTSNPPEQTGRTGSRRSRDDRNEIKKPSGRLRRSVNWALMWTILAALLLLAAAGGFLYLKTTDNGQLILARMGYEANADALWSLGTEYLDQGYVDKAIFCYETAYAQDPQREDIYAKLLLLGEAYEAAGQMDRAEELYIRLYTSVNSENTTAYRLYASILADQGRRLELAELLKVAYEKTGDSTFLRQRNDMLPSSPTASLAAGKYQLDLKTLEQYKKVILQSKEGYDIYYLLNGDENATLPEDGTLYTTPLKLPEGYHTIRAIALSSDLISDEMTASYTVVAPIPMSPKLSLAPDDYQTRQRVWIRYNGDDADSVDIYYTIDGQSPTTNSPKYDGEPFWLPGGRIHVKAIAINAYGKVSNEMDVELKINIAFKKYFNEKDNFQNATILSTSRDQFVRSFGEPDSEKEFTSEVSPACLDLTYSWGYARFMPTTTGYVLYEYDTTDPSVSGPRNTRINMTETNITEKFRDMGQAKDQNGDRSIYWDAAEGYAKLYHLDETNDRIDYVDYREDNTLVMLSYYLENGVVKRMSIRYR